MAALNQSHCSVLNSGTFFSMVSMCVLYLTLTSSWNRRTSSMNTRPQIHTCPENMTPRKPSTMMTPQKTRVKILDALDSSLATAAPVMAARVPPTIFVGSASSALTAFLAGVAFLGVAFLGVAFLAGVAFLGLEAEREGVLERALAGLGLLAGVLERPLVAGI
jgi:hypothetical protein